MAAEESSQGAALGPDISNPGRNRSADQGRLTLDDVLGQFMDALCIVQVVSCALTEASADASEHVGFCAVALKQGVAMLDAAYNDFDHALARDSEGVPDDVDDGIGL